MSNKKADKERIKRLKNYVNQISISVPSIKFEIISKIEDGELTNSTEIHAEIKKLEERKREEAAMQEKERKLDEKLRKERERKKLEEYIKEKERKSEFTTIVENTALPFGSKLTLKFKIDHNIILNKDKLYREIHEEEIRNKISEELRKEGEKRIIEEILRKEEEETACQKNGTEMVEEERKKKELNPSIIEHIQNFGLEHNCMTFINYRFFSYGSIWFECDGEILYFKRWDGTILEKINNEILEDITVFLLPIHVDMTLNEDSIKILPYRKIYKNGDGEWKVQSKGFGGELASFII